MTAGYRVSAYSNLSINNSIHTISSTSYNLIRKSHPFLGFSATRNLLHYQDKSREISDPYLIYHFVFSGLLEFSRLASPACTMENEQIITGKFFSQEIGSPSNMTSAFRPLHDLKKQATALQNFLLHRFFFALHRCLLCK